MHNVIIICDQKRKTLYSLTFSSNLFGIQTINLRVSIFVTVKTFFFFIVKAIVDNVHVTDKNTTKEISLIYSLGEKCGFVLKPNFTPLSSIHGF